MCALTEFLQTDEQHRKFCNVIERWIFAPLERKCLVSCLSGETRKYHACSIILTVHVCPCHMVVCPCPCHDVMLIGTVITRENDMNLSMYRVK